MTVTTPAPAVARALREAAPRVFWSDRPDAPASRPPLLEHTTADLVVVGGGLTGLWAAFRAAERGQHDDIVLLDAERVGFGASGRNGGFISASLTHGLAHGESMWPAEMARLHEAGEVNLAQIAVTLTAEDIDAGLDLCGKTTVAVADWQVDALRTGYERAVRYGEDVEWQDGDQVRADVASPTYLAGLRVRSGGGLVDPARLCWGLAAAATRRGVRIYESTTVDGVEREGTGVRVTTTSGTVHARQVVVATAAYRSPLRRLDHYVLPVYDHVLVTEPLSADQLASVGWSGRQGMTDAGNQFHYYRLTADHRILWGGWDAIYHRGGTTDPRHEQRWPSFVTLAEHFFATFPQLEGIMFTHRWAGPIDSTSRFTAMYGTAVGGRVAYAVGHTGLGVGASRFSADVALDLLSGQPTERTSYRMVTRRPVPFPPEPLRDPVVQATRSSLLAADAHEGRRNAWLRLLDRYGVGFAS